MSILVLPPSFPKILFPRSLQAFSISPTWFPPIRQIIGPREGNPPPPPPPPPRSFIHPPLDQLLSIISFANRRQKISHCFDLAHCNSAINGAFHSSFNHLLIGDKKPLAWLLTSLTGICPSIALFIARWRCEVARILGEQK